MIKCLFPIFLIYTICSAELYAQHIVDPQLRNPIQQAINSNRSIVGKGYEKDKTLLEAANVKSKSLPHITANAFYGYLHSAGNLDLPTLNSPNNLISLFEGSKDFKSQGQAGLVSINATQVIFSGFQITNGRKAIMEKAKAQGLLLEADKEQIAKSVVQSFDQLMLLKEVDTLIEDSEKRLEKEHTKIIKAIENGLAIPYDRDKLTLAMLELQAKKVELAGTRELIYQKLEQETSMPLEDLKKVDYTLENILLENIDFGVEARKELQALDASQRAYEYVLRKEKGAALPQIFAFGSSAYANIFNTSLNLKQLPLLGDVNLRSNSLKFFPTFIVGVGAKWDIFNGNEHRNKVKSAQLDLVINQNKRDDISEQLQLLLKKNKVTYQTAIRSLAVNKQQVKVANNNLYLAARQYQEGLVEVTERLAAENDYYKASLAYYSQLLQQRQSALELLHSSGKLLNSLFSSYETL